jgi:hypothetical protein
MNKENFIFCWLLLLLLGCSQKEKDKGIKGIISSTAKQEIAFAGVNYIVKNGVVTLSGNALTDKDR